MLLNELKPDFQRVLRREMQPGEQLLWYSQPDPDSVARSLLPYSVVWLSGLFLMSTGMLLQTPGDTQKLLVGLVVILVLVASAGVLELIFVPRRASRTVYILTNQRAMSVFVTKKLSINPDEDDEKRILREEKSTPKTFYMSNLPSYILLLLLASDVVRSLSLHLDIFLASGFGLILTGWTMPWFQELRLPIAKYREAPRVLYSIQDMFVAVQFLSKEAIKKVKVRRLGKQLFNVCLITDNMGCLRFRAVLEKEGTDSLIAALHTERS
jgi:hypothetical protein